MKMPLEIVVRGMPGAGKTHVSRGIKRWLEEVYGFDVEIVDDGEPQSADSALTHRALEHLASERRVCIRTELEPKRDR